MTRPASDPVALKVALNLDAAVANHHADTVMRVLRTPWPYGSAHVSTGPDDCDVAPERLHPCFHGALDWHSSCHMQWSAVVLLDSGLLDADTAAGLAALLDERLTLDRGRIEADYLRAHPGFERPYGWGWLAVLAGATASSPHPRARDWAAATAPIADVVADHVLAWLPRQALPVRHGVHQNSAFGLTLLREGFEALGRDDVVSAVDARARDWFAADAALPVAFEPSGTDFLSPSLSEAELMRHVLEPAEFVLWLRTALPLLGDDADPLLVAPTLTDRSDGQLVHLFGLCLSRAAQLRGIAARQRPDRARRLLDAADRMVALATPEVDGGDFMSTHWLVSFLLRAVAQEPRPVTDAAGAGWPGGPN